MTKVFPLLRPERSRWYRVGIGCWVLLLVWMWISRDQLKPVNYLFGAILFAMAVVRDLRLRLTPDRKVEMDDSIIRLLPDGHWVVNEIDRGNVIGRREESSGIFLHFKDEGIERAVEFERRLFSEADWKELAGLLQEGSGLMPSAL